MATLALTTGDCSALTTLRRSVAADMALLVRLHDRDLDLLAIQLLRASQFPRKLALPLRSQQGQASIVMLEKAVAELSSAPGVLDRMSEAYGVLYLAPDRVCARGRLKRTGDDLVVQLTVVSQLVANDGGRRALVEAERYIQTHLVERIGCFSAWVDKRRGHPFYAALAHLTDAYVLELHETLSDILAMPEIEAIAAASASVRAARS